MQAVILTAGRGTRLRPVTYNIPKGMIRIAGKNLIEHNIDKLPQEIDELIFVVGYLSPQIINHFGDELEGRKVRYVKQRNLLGTGHALKSCQEILNERFLVIMGDDLYSRSDIERCLKYQNCILTQEVFGKFIGGRVKLNSSGHLENIVEGVHNKKKSLANTGLYVLTDDFFKYDLVKLPNRDEYGLPQTIVNMAKDYPFEVERAIFWLQINDLVALRRAEKTINKNN